MPPLSRRCTPSSSRPDCDQRSGRPADLEQAVRGHLRQAAGGVGVGSVHRDPGPYAQQSQRDYGVPAAIALAQATQETGYGRSAPGGNNYFGVKCHNQSSPVVVACENRKTTEWVNGQQVEATEPFRSYASMKDSVTDYAGFLKQNSRYAPRLRGQRGGRRCLRPRSAERRYATDPNYAESLITLMKANDYYRYNVS